MSGISKMERTFNKVRFRRSTFQESSEQGNSPFPLCHTFLLRGKSSSNIESIKAPTYILRIIQLLFRYCHSFVPTLLVIYIQCIILLSIIPRNTMDMFLDFFKLATLTMEEVMSIMIMDMEEETIFMFQQDIHITNLITTNPIQFII